MPHVPPAYRPTSNASVQQKTTGVRVPPVYRPGAGLHRPAPPRVVQRAVRERDLVGIPLTSSGAAVSVGQTLGQWTLSIVGDSADVWTHSSDNWKASYYRISGDYHVKGFRGARRDYEIGTFSGVARTTGGQTHAAERDTVYASFQSDVIDSVPGYRR